MIANPSVQGLDVLDAMISAAAARASSHLIGTVRFAKCDNVQLSAGYAVPDVELEAWSVSEEPQAIVISVFATAHREDGGRTTAASGRFTFTTVSHKQELRN